MSATRRRGIRLPQPDSPGGGTSPRSLSPGGTALDDDDPVRGNFLVQHSPQLCSHTSFYALFDSLEVRFASSSSEQWATRTRIPPQRGVHHPNSYCVCPSILQNKPSRPGCVRYQTIFTPLLCFTHAVTRFSIDSTVVSTFPNNCTDLIAAFTLALFCPKALMKYILESLLPIIFYGNTTSTFILHLQSCSSVLLGGLLDLMVISSSRLLVIHTPRIMFPSSACELCQPSLAV